jgi:hypothetical protein
VVSRLTAAGGAAVVSYTGLVARSPREGYWLVYPRLDMGTCVEIRQEDTVHTERLPPERSPFGSLGLLRTQFRRFIQSRDHKGAVV